MQDLLEEAEEEHSRVLQEKHSKISEMSAEMLVRNLRVEELTGSLAKAEGALSKSQCELRQCKNELEQTSLEFEIVT